MIRRGESSRLLSDRGSGPRGVRAGKRWLRRRSPAGTESLWTYTHLPRGLRWTAARLAAQAQRMAAAIEAVAPGFGDLVLASHVQGPAEATSVHEMPCLTQSGGHQV
jgi:hypothetical protein